MTTQPVWSAARQSGVARKSPPRSLPSASSTFVPISRADSIRPATGRPSTSSATSRLSIIAPWLCPTSTKGRPSLSCDEVVAEGGAHVGIGQVATAPLPARQRGGAQAR